MEPNVAGKMDKSAMTGIELGNDNLINIMNQIDDDAKYFELQLIASASTQSEHISDFQELRRVNEELSRMCGEQSQVLVIQNKNAQINDLQLAITSQAEIDNIFSFQTLVEAQRKR